MVEALQLALQKVPVSDFEGDYWGDLGGFRMGIKSSVPFIREVPIDEDINFALIYYEGEFKRIMIGFTNSVDLDRFDREVNALLSSNPSPDRAERILIEFDRDLINRCYDELVNFAKNQYSRYAYQALAIFLMEHGAKMKDDLKKLILDNSRWGDERYNLDEKYMRVQRRKFLLEFRAKILAYREAGDFSTIEVFRN